MKSQQITLLVTFLSALVLSACGGGGGGGGGLGTGTFTKTMVLSGVDTSYIGALDATADARYQVMYRASDINGAGKINAISLRMHNDEVATTCTTVTIRMGHTNLADLTTTYANNVQTGKGSYVTVLDSGTVSIPAGVAGDYFRINLTTPFNYNGVDNLVYEISRVNACSNAVALRGTPDAVAYTGMNFNSSDAAAVTGSTVSQPFNTIFHFAGGDNFVTLGGTVSNSYPFATTAPRAQFLYLASEINGSGAITGLAFQMNVASTEATNTATIRLGHTSLATLGTTFANNFNSGSPVVVATTVNFTIPAGLVAGDWFWVPIPASTFSYNGTSNLIVDVTTTAGSSDVNYLRTTAMTDRRVANADNTQLSGVVSDSVPNVKFRFYGGTMDVITDEATSTGFAFSSATNGRMNFYRATELGTAATINSVACRMNTATSTASAFANYKVILGHSTLDSLDGVSANNFVTQHVGFNGTFNLPSGLLQGDWITVNLTSPFSYNGTDNLVVWMGTTAASGGTTHDCMTSSTNATRYPDHMGSAAPDAGGVGTIDFKFDMRLGFYK